MFEKMPGRKEDLDIEKIIEGCKKNDRKSQKILYDQYFDPLYVHCRHYQLPEEDSISLINSTMLKVFQKIHLYRKKGALESWIHTIHKNEILNHFRHLKRQRKHLEIDSEYVNHNSRASDDQQSKINLDHIYLAMEKLTETERKIVTLYAIEGYNYREIAQKLEISESASKWHMKNARAAISKRINQGHG